jgi:predicted glycosyltransferase
MKVLIDIGHPAHVHFYKNTIKELESRGHEVLVTARDKEVTVKLLDAYGIEHTVLSSMKQGKGNLIKEWIIRDYKLLQISRKFKPDVLTGILNPPVAHVSWLLRKKSIIFNDTEHATFAQKITYPFSDVICIPSCYMNPVGIKNVVYEGYHELAYLHPKYFTPNPSVLQEMGLTEDDRFIIVRFVSWGAHHDVGHHGIKDKIQFINELEKYGKVIITSEKELEPELEQYKLKVSPEKLHDLLYYSTLYIGEGSTTASECAILGTHAIYINTLKLGYTNEQESKYDLVYNFSNENGVFEKAVELLKNPNLKEEGKKKREKLLEDKTDVTKFMLATILNDSDIL